jgi:hypothetical protein
MFIEMTNKSRPARRADLGNTRSMNIAVLAEGDLGNMPSINIALLAEGGIHSW